MRRARGLLSVEDHQLQRWRAARALGGPGGAGHAQGRGAGRRGAAHGPPGGARAAPQLPAAQAPPGGPAGSHPRISTANEQKRAEDVRRYYSLGGFCSLEEEVIRGVHHQVAAAAAPGHIRFAVHLHEKGRSISCRRVIIGHIDKFICDTGSGASVNAL